MSARVVTLVGFAGALLAFGCSVPEFEASLAEATPNTCQADAECGERGQCVTGACRATEGSFTSILFEITPPSDVAPVPDSESSIEIRGIRFFKFIDGLSAQGGAQNLALGHVAHVTGHVVPWGCEAAAAKITFTPSERLLGLSTPSYTADASAETGFDLWMPPGTYDVYVQPASDDTGVCAVLPQLLRKHPAGVIPAGDISLELRQPMPSELNVTIEWPADGTSVQFWTLDVVDPISGRVISERKVVDQVSPSSPLDGQLQYLTPIRYLPVAGTVIGMPGSELVRLSPPDNIVAPKLLMERSALEIFTQGAGVIDQVLQLPPTVKFAGRVTTLDPDQGVAATVTLIASVIDGLAAGTLAAFKREVVTNADGSFEVELLPGSYVVHTVPPGGSGIAAEVGRLEVAPFPPQQSGQLIQLDPSRVLSGRVLKPSGNEPVSGASVHAVASVCSAVLGDIANELGCTPSINETQFAAALGDRSFVPRASTSCAQNALCNIVDTDGVFSLEADPGRFDVSVRPPETTGFSWLVRPNVSLSSELVDLGEMKMPPPVAYSGIVSAPNGAPVARALIRAYVYMNSDGNYVPGPDEAISVLQIGETRAADDASFTLLLPSRLK